MRRIGRDALCGCYRDCFGLIPGRSLQSNAKTTMKKNILQIHYDAASKQMLDPGFIPLEIAGNPRADWREYWAIRHYFLDNTLNEDAYYGFLSPLFGQKTNLSAQQVHHYMDCNPGNDVYTFSPSIQDSACYLNVFEQGNKCHPGMINIAQEFFDSIDLSVDFTTLINDFRSCVYCNYIIAKPVFWEKWFSITERLYEIAENEQSNLSTELNKLTDYAKSAVEMKVFLIERIASFIMALAPDLKIAHFDINGMPWGNVLYFPCRKEMMILNALKIAYLDSRDPAYLTHYYSVRQDVLMRCEPNYAAAPRLNYF